MKICINGADKLVPDAYEQKLLADLYDFGTVEYLKLDATWRVVAKPLTRGILQKIESEVAKKSGKEAALAVRPAKNSDPTLHLARIFLAMLATAMHNITLSMEIEGDQLTAFNLDIPRSGGEINVTIDGPRDVPTNAALDSSEPGESQAGR